MRRVGDQGLDSLDACGYALENALLGFSSLGSWGGEVAFPCTNLCTISCSYLYECTVSKLVAIVCGLVVGNEGLLGACANEGEVAMGDFKWSATNGCLSLK